MLTARTKTFNINSELKTFVETVGVSDNGKDDWN